MIRQTNHMRNHNLTVLSAALAVVALFSGCAATPSAAPKVERASVSQAHVVHIPEPLVTFDAYGDSITTPTYLGASRYEKSWLNHLDRDKVEWMGGYAASGMRTDQIAANTVPISADCIVIMAGTNDVRQGQGPTTAMYWIDQIVARSGISNDRVIVSAIGPSVQPYGSMNLVYNTTLEAHAAAMGWAFVDPWASVRAADGNYVDPSMTYDGVHPVGTTQEITGRVLSNAIWALAHQKVMSK